MKKVGKIRADELVVKLGLCESRTQAQASILAGQVRMGTEKIDKASRMLSQESLLTIKRPPPYVGRGGLKMESFFKQFPLSVQGLDILDLGASTGGFSDFLLQQGAQSATCVDVGHGQLHYKLRTNPKVTNLEKTNLRHLTPEKLPLSPFPLVVMDLSFISLSKVLVRAWSFLSTGGSMIALVKPQFECTKMEADRGHGIIRDQSIQQRVLKEISEFANDYLTDSELYAQTESSPKGTDGNLEYFLAWKKSE